VIFPDNRSVLAFDALASDAGADDFRQPVEVDGIDAKSCLDLEAHLLRPGFRTKETEAQAG
jgi:hypothetical protein